ncbi:MAG: hypothetical protein COV66_07270 [Nitrospinae bacterium CG11_big_fil_rev_8_21_14_0_20_45_15]|nr:MAG: hypothetical protein COV66_07270 [Nitrospinae bacterium CG11_big_fil_rev_8_21_14_0_20_45_15]
MKIRHSLSIALTALGARKSRTFLSSLGIVIGIASVIIMVAIGKGSQKEVMDIIAGMGENLITINAGEMKVRGGQLRLTGNVSTLKPEDVKAIVDDVPGVELAVPFEIKQMQVKFEEASVETSIGGSYPDYQSVRNYSVARGRFFEERDVKTANRVGVIGETAIKNLFGDQDPLDQTIRVQRVPIKIIGVLDRKGLDSNGLDQDDIILIPLTTLQRRLSNQTFITTIFAKATRREVIPGVIADITDLLRERHKLSEGKEDDFTIISQLEMEEMKRETSEMFTRLIVGVAGISLVVGGIGILAVLLVSVKERTREIGVRRAVGASRWDVVNQFILESIVIGCFGGFTGIALGVGITLGMAEWGNWTLVLDWNAVFYATGACILIGVVFGMYPALKASRLDPMKALTVE